MVNKIPYKRKVKVTGGLWDAYKFYKNKYPESNINRKTYVETCHLFNKKLSNSIIKDSTEFRLFNRLGLLRIKAFKQKLKFTEDGRLDTSKNAVNWPKTWELWHQQYPDKTKDEIKDIPNKKVIIHLNEHSNGYSYRWYWDKRICNFKNQTLYSFKPVKGGISEDGYYYGRRGLSSWIKDDERTNEYYM